jgi:hypothetical protein
MFYGGKLKGMPPKLISDDKHCISTFDFELAKRMDILFQPFTVEYVSIL